MCKAGKAAGYVIYEKRLQWWYAEKDPRALPDDFVSGDTKMEGASLGKYVPEINQMLEQPNTDICASQFASKTGYQLRRNRVALEQPTCAWKRTKLAAKWTRTNDAQLPSQMLETRSTDIGYPR